MAFAGMNYLAVVVAAVAAWLAGAGWYALFGKSWMAAVGATPESMQAMRGRPKPCIQVKTRNLGDTVEIRIRDNGVGIPKDVRDRIFDPFFTTKAAGEGTGLGLSIAHDIVVQGHGGEISVDSQPNQYTEFTIKIPRVAE